MLRVDVGKRVVVRRRLGHTEIHPRRLRRAEIAVGAGVLHLVEGVAEHLVVGFLAVEQEVDRFAHLFVFDLAVEVFIDDLRALFGSDIREQVGAKIAGDRNVVARPGVSGSVYQPGIEPEHHVGLYLARGNRAVIDVVSVEQVYRFRDHLHVSELFGGDIHKQILDLGVLDPEALRHILHRGLQLAVAAAELLVKQRRLLRIRAFDANRVEQFLFVFEHNNTSLSVLLCALCGGYIRIIPLCFRCFRAS